MTTQRWTDEMLDTLAGVVAQNAGETAELRGTVEVFAENLRLLVQEQQLDRAEFRRRMETFEAEMREMRREMREMQINIREAQLDIRGLQTENRRILERLERRDEQG